MSLFESTWLMPFLLQFENEQGHCASLILGQKKALLFDTMCGIGDFSAAVREVTDLPLVVVNSHGHYDHVGGNAVFEQIYLNRADWHLFQKQLEMFDQIEKGTGQPLALARESLQSAEKLLDLTDGMVFDLGGRCVKVVALPGHTAGSMGLWLEQERILLVGDALSPSMCLFFAESLPLSVYRQTLEKAKALAPRFWVQGHYRKLFSFELLEELQHCLDALPQKRSFAYQNSKIPAWKGRVHPYRRNAEAGGLLCIITKETDDEVF